MNLNIAFTLRFKTTIAGAEFLAEVECDDLFAAHEKINSMKAARQGVELLAALMYISLAQPDGSCELLDNHSEAIYVGDLMQELKLGAEHYFNETMGAYDHIYNQITPADMGVVFPDGTLRLVWDREHAKLDFGTSVNIAKAAAEVLLQAQKMPYCQQTEDEEDECDAEPVRDRRTEVLFAVGLYPASDDTFNPVPAAKTKQVLAEYAKKEAPAAVAA